MLAKLVGSETITNVNRHIAYQLRYTISEGMPLHELKLYSVHELRELPGHERGVSCRCAAAASGLSRHKRIATKAFVS